MEITREVFDKLNKLEEAFSPVETLSRILSLYDNSDNETDYIDKVILINLLSVKILKLKNCLGKLSDELML